MAKNRYQCAKMQGYNLKLLKCFKGARNAPVPVLWSRGILRWRTQNYPPPVPSYLVQISLLHILLHIWRLLGVLHTFGRENETFPFCKDFFRVFPPFSLAGLPLGLLQFAHLAMQFPERNPRFFHVRRRSYLGVGWSLWLWYPILCRW